MPTVPALVGTKTGFPPAEAYEIRIAGIVRGRDDHLVPGLDEAARTRAVIALEVPWVTSTRSGGPIDRSDARDPRRSLREGARPAAIGVAGVVSVEGLHAGTGRGGRRGKFGFAQLKMGDVDARALEFRCSFEDFHRQKGLERLGSGGPRAGVGEIGTDMHPG